jgi:hypothetical protein
MPRANANGYSVVKNENLMLTQVGYIDGKELTLACQKEHKALEFNCVDHRNLDLKSNEKATTASVYDMTLKG